MICDLNEKTLIFSKEAIVLCKKMPNTQITIPLKNQFIRSSTSIGANYREAINGSSEKDFRNKIFICKKEAQESNYWIELLEASVPIAIPSDFAQIKDHCNELIRIFQKIVSTLKKKAECKV